MWWNLNLIIHVYHLCFKTFSNKRTKLTFFSLSKEHVYRFIKYKPGSEESAQVRMRIVTARTTKVAKGQSKIPQN